MKIKINLLMILLGIMVVLQLGCSNAAKDNKEPNNQETSQEKGNKDKDIEASADNDERIINEYEELLFDEGVSIADIIQYIKDNISQASIETATMMVERLEGEQEYYLSSLEEEFDSEKVQGILLEAMVGGEDYKDPANIQDEDVKALLNKTFSNGFSIDTAEGYVYPIIDYSIYEEFITYIYDDLALYYMIMVTEATKPFAKDAALLISWKEVIDRVLSTEIFIEEFGNSTKARLINDLHNRYVRVALYGLDNTLLFDYETKTMDEEAKVAYETAVDKYTGSEFISTLENFMDLVAKNDYILNDEVIKARDTIVGY